MIRQRIEALRGKISDSLFANVMDMTTQDIVENRIRYQQRTSFDAMIDRSLIALDVFILASRVNMCPHCDEKGNPDRANFCLNCGEKLMRKEG